MPPIVESAKNRTVNIDTRRPSNTAPNRKSMPRHQYVRLCYKVADVMPCASQATVMIKIKTLGA